MLGRVAAGEAEAIHECITRYGPLVWSIARRFAQAEAEAEAEEASAAIFVELWNHAGRYDPKLVSEAVFITMVARRHMLDRLRSRPERPAPEPAPDSLSSSEQHSEIERCTEASIAAGVLATLDPHQRRLLSLAIGQGMTYEEIAAVSSVEPHAVKSLVRRALVAVRKRLQAQDGSAA